MREYEIQPIGGFKHFDLWRINAPYLKLALKYGLVGPWRGNANPSVQFDAYCQNRGAKKGLPNLEDFRRTSLMTSNVDGEDEKRLEQWLRTKDGLDQIMRVTAALDDTPSLRELSDDRLWTIAEVAYGMIMDQVSLKNIRLAKVFKWLHTWACEHIPMIDTELYFAFIDEERTMTSDGKWEGIDYDSLTVNKIGLVLRDYKTLLCRHHEQFARLGQRLAQDCKLPLPIAPVRTLDNLIWMDWYALKRSEFREDGWIEYQSKLRGARYHKILEKGLRFYEERGFDRTLFSEGQAESS